MKINTTVLDQIIFDSEMNLEDELIELAQMPENFVNSICEKSYDEMTTKEKAEAVEKIGIYLRDNKE